MSSKERPGGYEHISTIDAPLCTMLMVDRMMPVCLQMCITHEPNAGAPGVISFAGVSGECYSLQIHPYILVPDWYSDVESLRVAAETEEVGEGSCLERGMQQERIGYGQAWYYPTGRTLVLWELMLYRQWKYDSPTAGDTLPTLWRAVERALLQQFPDTRCILTSSWEPAYDPITWHEFLGTLGFAPHPTDREVFRKLR